MKPPCSNKLTPSNMPANDSVQTPEPRKKKDVLEKQCVVTDELDKAALMRKQLLNGMGGPGSYLSRSQDNLTGAEPTSKRKCSTPSASVAGSRRPQSSLGLPKVNSVGGFSPSKSGSSPKVGSPSSLVKDIRSPRRTSQTTLVNAQRGGGRKAATHQADARINKTKTTVTELQKSKQELESQLSELTRRADTKQAEIARLKMEFRRSKEEQAESLVKLRLENDCLRKQVSQLSPGNEIGEERPETSSSSKKVETTERGTSPVSWTLVEGGCCAPEDISEPLPDWDGQSTSSQFSEVSVACLQDRLVQMEETHLSTNEELQATLQELTDLQDIVHDLTKENQLFCEEKQVLMESLVAKSQKLDRARLQIENLKHLLLSGLETAARRRYSEREVKLMEILAATHDDFEDLKCKYANRREEDARERQEMLQVLKDQVGVLETQLESALDARKALEDQVIVLKRQQDLDKRELGRLSGVFETEKQRLEELQRHSTANSKEELEALLETMRNEKNLAETRCAELEADIAEQARLTRWESARVSDLEKDLRSLNRRVVELSQGVECQEREIEANKNQTMEYRASIMELDEQCKRHMDDKLQYKANILTLQNHLEEVKVELEKLMREKDDLEQLYNGEMDDWKQFQSDLQTAVVVANDFKMEAQSDMEKLKEENTDLKEKLGTLSSEFNRLKESFRRTDNVPSTGHDVRTRKDEYLKSATPPTIGQQSRGDRRPNSGMSVRALIQSLEGAGDSHQCPVVTFRDTSPLTRSQGSLRHSLTPSGKSSASSSRAVESSTSALRPASADSLKSAISDTDISTPGGRRKAETLTLPEASLLPPTRSSPTTSDSTASSSSQTRTPKGILLNKTPPPMPAERKIVYLDPENGDPLMKLMKDAPRGSRRNALLKWCQTRAMGYENVEITNFSSSWNDGLAFCALLHSFMPEKIPFEGLDSKDKRRNFTVAFEAAEAVGIKGSLNAEELVALERPDWSSLMAYVTSIYRHFES